jgi:predicted ATP-grasp superfamily ATP-dependent carboligase
MEVLVTDDGFRASLGIVRTLGRRGIGVSVLADSPMMLASCSRYCSARYLLPPPTSADFLPALLELLAARRFDVILPAEYAFTSALARHKADILPLARLELSGFRQIRAAADKRLMLELATRCGVPVPQTVAPKSFEDAIIRSRKLRFPVVVKACRETADERPRRVPSHRELERIYGALCGKDGSKDPLPLIQEFTPGSNASFFALYQEGSCKRIFMHRRIREGLPSRRVSCCAESFYDPRLKEYGKRLLDRLRWHGVAMVEFRRDQRDGDYKLLEINPRFWGSLDLAIAAGVDFPYYVCQMAQGQTLTYSENYRRDLRYHWPLQDVRHALSRPASIFSVAADLLRPSVKSNFWWNDLKPNVMEPFWRMRARRGTQLRPSRLPGASRAAEWRADQALYPGPKPRGYYAQEVCGRKSEDEPGG